jgi:pSer/pThr/pTyr-binding forkhead associated (FHA) protein
MFLIEVDFNDELSEREAVLLKRSYARIGPSETSHLILDGIRLPCDIQVVKGYGDTFKCAPVFSDKNRQHQDDSFPWAGEYHRSIELCIEDVFISILSIDAVIAEFLMTHKNEVSCTRDLLDLVFTDKEPLLPAIQLVSDPKVALSLGQVDKCYIGKSRDCLFRMDHPGLRPQHALIKKNASSYSIESIGQDIQMSVNGRSIGSATKVLRGGDRIQLHDSLEVVFIADSQNLEDISNELGPAHFSLPSFSNVKMLRTVSGLINPTALSLREGQTIAIGRDPLHPVWINAAFISRLHATITLLNDAYTIVDYSSNGTIVNGIKLETEKEYTYNSAEVIHVIFGPEAEIMLSDFSDTEFQKWMRERVPSDIEPDADEVNQEALLESLKEIEVPLASVKEEDYSGMDSQALENNFSETISSEVLSAETSPEGVKSSGDLPKTFEEYQKKTLKTLQNKDSGNFIDLSLQDSMDSYSYENAQKSEFSKYLILLIITVILLVLGVFIVLGLNLTH